MAIKSLKPSFPGRPLNSDGDVAFAENRRRSQRQPRTAEAWVYSPTSTDPDERLKAATVNLSRTGVAFEIDHSLPTGAYFRIDIHLGDQRISSEIHIVSCRAVTSRQWVVGAEFC